MAIMKPQEYVGEYLEIDGPGGVDYLPTDRANLTNEELEAWQQEKKETRGPAALPASIMVYVENRKAYSITRGEGKLARWITAGPGFMDRTAWQPGDSRDLCEAEGVCPVCYEPLNHDVHQECKEV